MGLPTAEDNLAGYEQASLNSKVDNLRSKKYFLIHGTLDDNVHYQQSMMLAKTLEMKDILFEQQVWTYFYEPKKSYLVTWSDPLSEEIHIFYGWNNKISAVALKYYTTNISKWYFQNLFDKYYLKNQ